MLSDDKFPMGFVPIRTAPIIQPAPQTPAAMPKYKQADDYFSAFHPDPAREARLKSPRLRYEEAPIPPGVHYPDPPARPSTAAGFSAAGSAKSAAQHSRKRGMSTGAPPMPTMSPNALARPFSMFSDSP